MARDRDDDYEDDDRPARKEKPGGLDGFFGNTPVAIIVAIVLMFCCNIGGAIFGLVGMITCKDPTAKRNATIMMVLGGIMFIVGLILNFSGALANLK